MKSRAKAKNLTVVSNKQVNTIYQQIASLIREARTNIVRTIDTTMVHTYWHIGKYIVEEEQRGDTKADYGEYLISELSLRLIKEFGNGFSTATLKNARQFYIVYSTPIGYALRSQFKKSAISYAVRRKLETPKLNPNLSWTHYRALMREDRPLARAFYETESAKNCWSARELERQMASLLFERLAKSKDKKGLMKLAKKGQEILNPEDAIKDPFVLEFAGLPESHKLVESKLEDALINNMQNFLLELGQGFAFVARQKRLTLDGAHFYCDLVFYHTTLKCYIILDLKTKELTHSDLGQMQLYVNYFDMEIKTENDNPTIGLILCTKKSKNMVKYFLGKKANNIFASKYQFSLPTEKELTHELKRGLKKIQHQLANSQTSETY